MKDDKQSKFSNDMARVKIRATWRSELAYWICLRVLIPLLRWKGIQINPQDDYKHAPGCPANRWSGAQKVTMTCTCGAVYWHYHDQVVAAWKPSCWLITWKDGSRTIIDRAPDSYEARESKSMQGIYLSPKQERF